MCDGFEFIGDYESGFDVCFMIREKLKRGFYLVSDNIFYGFKRKVSC